MSAHTAGPWFTKREGSSTVYVEAQIGGGWLQEIAACGPNANGSGEQDANARLIAAAPELLDALQKALETITDERIGKWSYMEGSQIYDDFNEAADQIRAAISKAVQP